MQLNAYFDHFVMSFYVDVISSYRFSVSDLGEYRKDSRGRLAFCQLHKLQNLDKSHPKVANGTSISATFICCFS